MRLSHYEELINIYLIMMDGGATVFVTCWKSSIDHALFILGTTANIIRHWVNMVCWLYCIAVYCSTEEVG